jgi:hypothetical protein
MNHDNAITVANATTVTRIIQFEGGRISLTKIAEAIMASSSSHDPTISVRANAMFRVRETTR